MSDKLFTLRVKLGGKLAIIHAWEGIQTGHHTRIDVSLTHGGTVVFPRGATYCGLPVHASLDGVDAKELVLSLFAMKPGDTDADYFASYSPSQLEFARHYGEELDMVRSDRYCGNVKRGTR